MECSRSGYIQPEWLGEILATHQGTVAGLRDAVVKEKLFREEKLKFPTTMQSKSGPSSALNPFGGARLIRSPTSNHIPLPTVKRQHHLGHIYAHIQSMDLFHTSRFVSV